jgi:2-polyprenyl-3-methyl-5-hydroxy-6-metoxy-1,4-benzoquinol methylase
MNKDYCCICKKETNTVLWSEGGCCIVYCPRCSLYFQSPLPVIDINELYNAGYYSGNYVEQHAVRKNYFCKRLVEIERFVPAGKLLDIGAGVGIFLQAAKERSWEGAGVEPSLHAANLANSLLGRQIVTPMTFDAFEASAATYDLITMWDVIAHVNNPSEYLHKIHALLKDTGMLVIKTPHWTRANFLLAKLYALFTGKSSYFLHVPQQLFMFNTVSLKKLLESCGFSIMEMKYVDEAVSGNAHHSDNRIKNTIARVMWRLMDCLRMHPSILVFAKKCGVNS